MDPGISLLLFPSVVFANPLPDVDTTTVSRLSGKFPVTVTLKTITFQVRAEFIRFDWDKTDTELIDDNLRAFLDCTKE